MGFKSTVMNATLDRAVRPVSGAQLGADQGDRWSTLRGFDERCFIQETEFVTAIHGPRQAGLWQLPRKSPPSWRRLR